MTDDIELLRRYVETSSHEAFAELVRRHIDFVYAAARRQVRNEHRAEDVTQAVFVALARKAVSLLSRRELLGWLYLSTHYAATDLIRQDARRAAREHAIAMIQDTEPTSDASVDWTRLTPVFDAVLRDLNEADRTAVLLRFSKQLSFADVGAGLHLSEEAARKRVARALEKMRPLLARRGITSTTTALVIALASQPAMAAPSNLAATIAGTAAAAGAASGNVTVISLGHLMNAAKSTLTLATLVTLLAAGSLLRELFLLRAAGREATAAAIAAQAESDRLGRRLEALGLQATGLDRQVTELEASRAGVPAAVVADPVRPYLSDPAYRELYRVAKLDQRHFDFLRFYRMIGLSPENIARFEAIMVQQDLSNLDAMIARDTGGDEKAVNQRSGKAWNDAMGELLGPDGKKLLEDYLKYTSVRTFFDSLTTITSPVGDPLTVGQSDQLLQIALANDPTYQGGKGTDPSQVNWDAVWEPAAKILSDMQLSRLHTLVESHMLKKRLQDALNPSSK